MGMAVMAATAVSQARQWCANASWTGAVKFSIPTVSLMAKLLTFRHSARLWRQPGA